jgi:polyisoprenoid-binding protein YceI
MNVLRGLIPLFAFWAAAVAAATSGSMDPGEPAAAGGPVSAARYRLDAGNTRVAIDVRILGLPWLSAYFGDFSGELVADDGRTDSGVAVSLRTASLRCANARWNARLLSPEWFDAERYPQITFQSTRIHFDGRGGAVVSGPLSLHGRIRQFEFTVRRWGCPSEPSGAASCRFEAHGRMRRSDFGLPHGLREGGDEVEISIEGVGSLVAPGAVTTATADSPPLR